VKTVEPAVIKFDNTRVRNNKKSKYQIGLEGLRWCMSVQVYNKIAHTYNNNNSNNNNNSQICKAPYAKLQRR